MINYKNIKKICIISDCYVPQKISAAGMIYNLSRNISERGIEVTCVFSGEVPDLQSKLYEIKNIKFVTTTIVKSFRDKSLIFRFIFEILTSIMLSIKSFLYFQNDKKVDLIIWYGPSVFLWLVVKTVKYFNKVPVYYILRDIFPDWLIALKVIKNPFIIWILRIISNPQYSVSNVIGVETYENISYLKKKLSSKKKIELLFNWPNLILNSDNELDKIVNDNFNTYIISNRNNNNINCLYLGNSSVAHDYEAAIKFLDNNIRKPKDIEFNINIFGKLNSLIKPDNIYTKHMFWGLVPDYNIPFILSKVDCGIVSLNRNSKTHNIPGKFISYTQFKLPIICFANTNSSLAKLIIQFDCGIVIDLDRDFIENCKLISNFINNFNKKKVYFSKKSFKLFKERFDTKSISNQILDTFQ